MPNFKPSVLVQGEWATNALVFATEAEAAKSASDLFDRWTLCSGHRTLPTDDPVNYVLDLTTGEVRAVETNVLVYP